MFTRLLFVTLFTLPLLAFTRYSLDNYRIADDYVVQFEGRGANGTFRGLEGTIEFDTDRLAAARMDVRVAVATISTGNKTKDKHARGEGWFDAARYPTIRFQSTAFRRTADGYLVNGRLTLHGTTREIEFPFTFMPRADGGRFEGQFEVNRKDYGIEETFGQFAVTDNLTVTLRVPVTR